jgi:hypothetical protein
MSTLPYSGIPSRSTVAKKIIFYMKVREEPLSMQLAKYVRPTSCACRPYGNLPCTKHLMKVQLGVYSSNATTYLLNLL